MQKNIAVYIILIGCILTIVFSTLPAGATLLDVTWKGVVTGESGDRIDVGQKVNWSFTIDDKADDILLRGAWTGQPLLNDSKIITFTPIRFAFDPTFEAAFFAEPINRTSEFQVQQSDSQWASMSVQLYQERNNDTLLPDWESTHFYADYAFGAIPLVSGINLNVFYPPEVTPFPSATISISDVTISEAAAVPEPATLILFGTGLIGLAGATLKKKKK